MFSLFGASVGAFVRRRHSDAEQSAVAAVIGWWFAVILNVLVGVLQQYFRVPESLVAALIVGCPAITIVFAYLLRRVYMGETREPLRLVDSVLRRLVIRVGSTKNARTIDLRGVTIGLVSAAAVLSVARPIVTPAQQNVLAAMFRLVNQVGSSRLSLRSQQESKVALVRFDATATAAAMTTSSEAAEQAAMVRRLGRTKVAAIVLPAPTVDMHSVEEGNTSKSAVERTLKDLPDLTVAVKKEGKVILIVTPEQKVSTPLKPLMAAAAGVARFGEEPFGAALLPSVPLKWNRDQSPPAPLMALAMHSGSTSSTFVVKPVGGQYAVNGSTPTIAAALPDRAAVDFGANPFLGSVAIPTYASSELMAGNAAVPTDENPSHVDIDKHLRNDVVILEPLIHTDEDTPVGIMPRYEALARATNALINGQAIERGSPTAAMIWTLFLGVLIGSQCVGRDPLQASWRVALLMLVNFGYSLFSFTLLRIWADPVLPLVTATVAFLLVTQFTFAVERDERERNRALFSRFVAGAFVDELLQSTSRKLALGGEKRTVCVLFADVRNFTGFAESHPPEEVIEVMNIYLTALTDALDEFGGLLDKYTGDGLMAFFEIKGDVRTELVRSVNASLAMRDAAITVSERLRTAGKQALEIGIGMHYGEAIVGLVGNEQRQINYTALGHTVVVSARLQSLAEGGEVVVSEPIFAELSEAFEFSSMPPVFVKGITAEQRPYQVRRRVGNGM
jgi:class 3 adenylate cyclase